ncbi:MAG: hypothetical protein SF162_11120 [bacterium]|nr:hypothetical protein [bacterium]
MLRLAFCATTRPTPVYITLSNSARIDGRILPALHFDLPLIGRGWMGEGDSHVGGYPQFAAYLMGGRILDLDGDRFAGIGGGLWSARQNGFEVTGEPVDGSVQVHERSVLEPPHRA